MTAKTKSGHGGPRPGSGRPRKPPAAKQSEKVQVTFTPRERSELERLAGSEPLGSYIRNLVLRSLARRRR